MNKNFEGKVNTNDAESKTNNKNSVLTMITKKYEYKLSKNKLFIKNIYYGESNII